MSYAPQQITQFVPISRIGEGIACGHEVAKRLIEMGESVDLSDDRHETNFYIDVTGLDARSDQPNPALDRLPTGQLRTPFDQAYDQRDIHVNTSQH